MIDNLYEVIGGRQRIQSAVAIFYEKVIADESLRHFFQDSDVEHLRARQSMFLTMLLGGQEVYTGRDMPNAHARARMAGLTDVHFDRFLEHFRATLDEIGVEPGVIEKTMALLEANRRAVLGR